MIVLSIFLEHSISPMMLWLFWSKLLLIGFNLDFQRKLLKKLNYKMWIINSYLCNVRRTKLRLTYIKIMVCLHFRILSFVCPNQSVLLSYNNISNLTLSYFICVILFAIKIGYYILELKGLLGVKTMAKNHIPVMINMITPFVD